MTPPASDHFNGKTFFQPGSHPARGFKDFLRWRFTSKPAPWPQHVPLPPQAPPSPPRGDAVVATWLGHASFLVQTARGNVLFDPVFSERVSPFSWIGPKRVHPVPIALEALPPIDVVCLSHDHYDHWDAATVKWLAAARPETVLVVPLRHRDLLTRAGARQIVELDWWQEHTLPGGLTVTLTPTKHWSNRFGTPRNFRLWGGFWVEVQTNATGASRPQDEQAQPNATGASRLQGEPRARGYSGDATPSSRSASRHVWFVGDTGYDESLFAEVRRRLGAPDLALVPIGAYEPRWFMAPMHMNPAEAVALHRGIGARQSVAMHWGTFRLTDEARDEPVRALERARAEQGVSTEAFRVLEPGESVVR